MDHVDGTAPNGSAAYEKRGIAVDVPEWNPENCIQCNRCAIVCPHAVIRPVAMTADELAKAPEGTKSLPMMGLRYQLCNDSFNTRLYGLRRLCSGLSG